MIPSIRTLCFDTQLRENPSSIKSEALLEPNRASTKLNLDPELGATLKNDPNYP